MKFGRFIKWISTWRVCWAGWRQCRRRGRDVCRPSRRRWSLRKTSWSYKSGWWSGKRRTSSWLWTPSGDWALAGGRPADSADVNERRPPIEQPPGCRPTVPTTRSSSSKRPALQQPKRVAAFRRTFLWLLGPNKKRGQPNEFERRSANLLTFLSDWFSRV